MDAFVHPCSGELLPADEDSLARAFAETEVELGRIYRARAPLMERLAELRGPVEMPKPRFRSYAQASAARCPSCGRDHEAAA